MRYLKLFYCFLVTGFLIQPVLSSAQVLENAPKTTTSVPEDSLVTVEILYARKLEFRKINDSTQLQILAGDVRLKQGNSFFDCDSCVINNSANTFEAWGRVHINDADTANMYASHLLYIIDKKIAYLDGGVKLTDGKGTLTTPDLEYDMNTKIGIYKHGGTVINKKSILTSREGYYYADLKDIYFMGNVELKDPAYNITTDSLLYNTETETTRFIAYTVIKDSSGRIIHTREGYYNQKTGKAEFGQRPEIIDPKNGVSITANTMHIDDSTHTFLAIGNAVYRDSANNTTILAGKLFRNNDKDIVLATGKPLMIIKRDDDSIFVTADTLFSARLTDLHGGKDSLVKDTVKGTRVVNLNNKDSTNRYFEAYRHVRIFSDSLQAVCDSMFYSFKDSVFRMYDDPVLWSKQNQITGDTVFLYTKNKKADRVKVFENSLLVNKMDPGIYNQVKSTRMDALFTNGSIDSVRCKGLAECIYYIQDEDSAYSGINESKSDAIDIYFRNDSLQKVVFRSSVTGTIWPIKQKSPGEMKLPGFKWLDARRPKSRLELFE